MMLVKDMIEKIRWETHDEQATGYGDDTLLSYINDGVRFVRRTIMDVYPTAIANINETGTLDTGINEIKLENKYTVLIDVRADGRRLIPRSLRDIDDTKRQGRPEYYVASGFDTLYVYPIPERICDYMVTAIGDMQQLELEGASPFPNDFDDFVIEYALMRASLTNEFDMSQEQSIMGSIVGQVEARLRAFLPAGVEPGGYWQARDYLRPNGTRWIR